MPAATSLLARLRGYSPVGPRSDSSHRDKSSQRKKPIIITLCIFIPLCLLIFYHDSVPLPTASISSWTSSSGTEELPEGNGWEIVAAVKKRDGIKRTSWGALKQQGARSHIRENLRDDKKYLFTMYGAGWNNQVITMFNCKSLFL